MGCVFQIIKDEEGRSEWDCWKSPWVVVSGLLNNAGWPQTSGCSALCQQYAVAVLIGQCLLTRGHGVSLLLTPKNKLLGIVRHENRQPSDGRKASCISPYKSLQNRAICHPGNWEDSQMSWVEARGAARASRTCHRNPGLVHGVRCLGAPGPGCHPCLLHRCHCKVMCPPLVLSGLINWGVRGEKEKGQMVSATQFPDGSSGVRGEAKI